MARALGKVVTVTIPATQTESPIAEVDPGLASIGIGASGGAFTGVITLNVALAEGGTTFYIKRSNGADITLANGRADTVTEINFRRLKFVSTLAEAGTRTFEIVMRAPD